MRRTPPKTQPEFRSEGACRDPAENVGCISRRRGLRPSGRVGDSRRARIPRCRRPERLFIGFDRREIRSLLDDGKYEASALAANRYLKKHPDDVDAAAWGQEALAKTMAAAWAGLIEKKRFDEAADYLQKQKQAHAFNRRGQEMIALLSWAGKVEAHMADRGGATAPVVMFRDEEPIRALVAEWTATARGTSNSWTSS